MTYLLCDEWAPRNSLDEPCHRFYIPTRFNSTDIGEWLSDIIIKCDDHESYVTHYDSLDEFTEALDEAWDQAGWSTCSWCALRHDSWSDHLTDNFPCTESLNDEHNSFQYYIGDELEDADRWRGILAHHDIAPHPAFERYVAGFDEVTPTCDICNEPELELDADWNGVTGNHITCEETEARRTAPIVTLRDAWLRAAA